MNSEHERVCSLNIGAATHCLLRTKGREEILGQLCEECNELGVAAQKVRRVWAGTTTANEDDVFMNLVEECADVLNMIEALEQIDLIDMECVRRIRANKADRWKRRVVDGDWSE